MLLLTQVLNVKIYQQATILNVMPNHMAHTEMEAHSKVHFLLLLLKNFDVGVARLTFLSEGHVSEYLLKTFTALHQSDWLMHLLLVAGSLCGHSPECGQSPEYILGAQHKLIA